MTIAKNPINWQVFEGPAQVKPDGTLFYEVNKSAVKKGGSDASDESESTRTRNSTALLKSSAYFSNGEIEFQVIFGGASSKLNILLDEAGSADSQVAIGINVGKYLYGIGRVTKDSFPNVNDIYKSTGQLAKLITGKELHFKIRAIGSRLWLYIDDIEVCNASIAIKKSQIEVIMQSSEGNIEISQFKVNGQKPQAFIVMQFTQEYNQLYESVIKPVCERNGLACVRADDINAASFIISDIIQKINESSIVIADITPNNPNVYYEVGYSHGLNKNTILLCDRTRPEKLPFDISGIRTIFYENSIAGKQEIERNLEKFLIEAFKE